MADIDNAASGKDVSVQFTLDGAPVQVQDNVTNFTAEPELAEIRSQHIGRTGSDIDQDFGGWKGTVEITVNTAAADDLIDSVINGVINRIPIVINLAETTRYRNATSRSYVYPDCKLTMSKRVKRGDATAVTFNWMTGKNRLPL